MHIKQFKDIFDCRHDFKDDDLEILKERWPTVKFVNIPVAWIVPIDEMMVRLRYSGLVFEVRQEFGHLIVISEDLTENQRKIIYKAEEVIYTIDVDLHERLEKGDAANNAALN